MDELQLIRQIIDGCDEALRDSFLRRMDASLSEAKKRLVTNTPIYDPADAQRVIDHVSYGLSPELAAKATVLWSSLLRMSRGRQYKYFVENARDIGL